MDSTPVNWEALDDLVIDFAKSERLLEDSPPSSPRISPSPASSSLFASSSLYRSRLLIRQVRRAIEGGDIDAAIDRLRAYAPAVLDDHRILFQLHKQKFIEQLRKGTEEDRESAITCLRVALAPCALDAYPEAYQEFKHVLLALVFDDKDQSSPVVNEWSARRRFELAGLLSTILTAQLQAYDPIFSMTLKYLISIYKVYCCRQGVTSPISDLVGRLLFEDRDPPATPQESLYEAPPFDEVDVQALAHAVELTRQSAVDSLRCAKGDLLQAFQNELCRMKLDMSMLDKLVHEYCVYRGIVDALPNSSPDLARDSPMDCSSLNLESSSSRISDGEVSLNNSDTGVSEPYPETGSMQEIINESRLVCEMNNIHDEDCSTSDFRHQENSCRRLRRNRNYSTGQGRQKRWRGRARTLEYNSHALMEMPKQEVLSHTIDNTKDAIVEELVRVHVPGSRLYLRTEIIGNVLSHFMTKNIFFPQKLESTEDQKYEIIFELRDLAYKGMVSKVVEEINAIDPDFFSQNPGLLFQLKQVEFLALVNSGDHAKALKVASTHLGPLAANDQTLMKPLKETLIALLSPTGDALEKGTPLPLLATSLQVAVGRKFGIEEPQLMKVVRATIHTHNEWFKLQMCKDRFEQLLKIDNLKGVNTPIYGDNTSKTYPDDCTDGSSQITIASSIKNTEDGSSPQISSGEVIYDENAILKVMEFLAMPRSDAIHLLMQYNGNAETVIQQLFS